VDEFVSGAAGGYGNAGGRIFAVAGFLFPIVGTPLFRGHLGSYEFRFTVAQPLAAVVVLVVTAINYLSVRMGGAIQVLLTCLKMGTIVVL